MFGESPQVRGPWMVRWPLCDHARTRVHSILVERSLLSTSNGQKMMMKGMQSRTEFSFHTAMTIERIADMPSSDRSARNECAHVLKCCGVKNTHTKNPSAHTDESLDTLQFLCTRCRVYLTCRTTRKRSERSTVGSIWTIQHPRTGKQCSVTSSRR